jgi:hypothetical protein
MIFHRICLAGITPLILSLLMTALAWAHPLDGFRNHNRLILLSIAEQGSTSKIAATIKDARNALSERDLKIIDLSVRPADIEGLIRLSDEQTALLRKEYQWKKEETRNAYVLIGKDGGEKDRQYVTLDLVKWFHLIDQMPMRRQEMHSRGRGRM